MSDVALLLGPIVFQDFEIPSGINFGGRQRLALHRLPGGSRVIDALGRDDSEIGFSGIFTGSDATLRARTLDELRAAGTPLALTWDVLYYSVVISAFYAEYRNSWWIPYNIVCTVLRDEAAALLESATSLVTAALADIGMAVDYSGGTGVDLTPVQAALAASGATVRGTSTYTTAQYSLANAQSEIGSSIDTADAALSSAAFVSGSAQDGTTSLVAATEAAGLLCSLVSAQAYIRRTTSNLANAST
jgi:hypothetical protein